MRRNKFTLYIGRQFAEFNGSKWQNPFPVQIYGRRMCLTLYEAYVREHLWEHLHELDGQTLGCWCHPRSCHGDVLVRLRREQLNVSRSSVPSAG